MLNNDKSGPCYPPPVLCDKTTKPREMAKVPAEDKLITPDNAVDVLEELLPAQNKSYELGLKLKLPQSEVESIHSQHPQPRQRLLHILIAFANQTKAKPTWRVIVEALSSLAVNLARELGAAHFTEPTSTRDVLPETEDESAANTVCADDEGKLNQLSTLTDSILKREVKGFHRRFNSIKESTIKCLEKCRITVVSVVYLLTSVLGVGEHRKFLEDKQKKLRKSDDHWELFGQLNLYWNYLSFDLLDKLIDELVEKNSEFEEIKKEMEVYKEGMERFRESTTLLLFCQVERHEDADPPPGFRKMVTEHRWPETITLKDVEEFRRRFLYTFGLPQCAMMVYRIQTKCFEVTWFGALPISVGVLLRESEGNIKVFREFKVISVEIDGDCVYQPPTHLPQPLPVVANVTQVSPLPHLQTQVYDSGYKPSLTSSLSVASLSTSDGSEMLQVIAMPKKIPASPGKAQLTVHCHERSTAPWQMDRGSAAANNEFVYFAPHGLTSLYRMELSSDDWKELRPCPYRNSGLVVIDNELTTVGGLCRFVTKKLLTLQKRKWVEEYPPMITARSSPAVVCTSNEQYLVVIGGLGRRGCWTTAVEVLQVKTRLWNRLNDLPQPLCYPSAIICGNHLHAIGDCTDGYSCSLEAILSRASRPPVERLISWKSLPPIPVEVATAATLSGQLVIIGGVQNGSLISSIFQLLDKQWVKIGCMARSRSWCLVASPSPDKIIAVGGQGALKHVEEFVAQESSYHKL